LSSAAWSHALIQDPDGSVRVEITDEDGQAFPVGRRLGRGQAEALVQRIADEARTSGRPIKAVIRDAYFMAATVLTVKRLPPR
jgi:hypothetical protein